MRIESSQSGQEIDPITVSIDEDEHRWNGIIRVPATQICLEARLLEERAQACELGNSYGNQCISIGTCAQRAMYGSGDGTDHGVVDRLRLEYRNRVKEQ